MTACPHCGTDLPADAAFCFACGQKTASPSEAERGGRGPKGTMMMPGGPTQLRSGRTLMMPTALDQAVADDEPPAAEEPPVADEPPAAESDRRRRKISP